MRSVVLNKAVDKMRKETIRLRSKINESQHEKSDLIKQHESPISPMKKKQRQSESQAFWIFDHY